MTQDESAPRGLSAWLARIRDAELPIFGATAERIRELSESEKAAVSDLAEAILRDQGMTAKLLRIANSVIFNASGAPITTVSRAIVMLGFDMVREIALTVAFVDGFLRGGMRERVEREMARAFHAAVQARWLALRRHDAQPEEVFIAALLYRFGELAFWCVAGESGEALDAALRRDPLHAAEIEQSQLGFRLHQLTPALTRDWRVSPLLQSVLRGGYARRSREQAVVIAFGLAEGAERGWDSEQAQSRLRQAADYLQLPLGEVAGPLMQNAAEAAAFAASYGAEQTARYIPQ